MIEFLIEDKEFQSALSLAKEAHAGQFRRDKVTPYIEHPIRLARKAYKKFGRLAAIVALLHDVLEDNKFFTAQYLLDNGISQEVVDAVVALTKIEGEDYFTEYLPRVYANILASQVKIIDIIDNLSDDPSSKQIWKYSRALVILTEE